MSRRHKQWLALTCIAIVLAWCSYYTMHVRDGETAVRLNGLDIGEVVLNNLKPGVPFQLHVEGPYGRTVLLRDVPALAPEEHRTMDITLADMPCTLRGRVVAPAGAGVPHATVAIRWTNSDCSESASLWSKRSVDAAGRFSFGSIFSPRAFLVVEATGFTPSWLPAVEVPTDGRELTVTLYPGKAVTVTVVDVSGAMLPARVSCALPSGARIFESRTDEGDGVHVLRGLPDGEVSITATVYGTPFTTTHDARDPELRVEVPLLGRVEAYMPLFDGDPPDETCLMCLSPAADPNLREVYARVDPNGREPSVFPGVLPGEYVATLRRYPDGFADMSSYVEMSSRLPVVVRAAETLELEVW